ncbi:MAG: hypothetical protein WKF90_02675 [Pyrinomonadaceae bacterium]
MPDRPAPAGSSYHTKPKRAKATGFSELSRILLARRHSPYRIKNAKRSDKFRRAPTSR